MVERRTFTRWIRMPRRQAFQVALGLVLLAIVIAVYAPHLANNISTNSVIDAQVVPVASPIEGVMTIAPPVGGMSARAGDVPAEIKEPDIDRGRLHNLSTEAGSIREQIASQYQVNAQPHRHTIAATSPKKGIEIASSVAIRCSLGARGNGRGGVGRSIGHSFISWAPEGAGFVANGRRGRRESTDWGPLVTYLA